MIELPKVTRKKLLKALRAFDEFRERTPNSNLVLEVSAFEIDNSMDEPEMTEVKVNLRLEYANYEYLAREIYGGPEIKEGFFTSKAPIGIIRDEIQRMTNDGLVTLGMQGSHFSVVNKTNGEEERCDPSQLFSSDEIRDYKTKIVLTTKGKNTLEYFKSNFPENATAWFALLISAVALLVSIFK